MSTKRTLLTAILLFSPVPLASATTLSELATSFGLTASTTLAFPAESLNSNQSVSWLKSYWALNNNRIQFGEASLSFTDDPATDSSLSRRQSNVSRTSRTSSRSRSASSTSSAAALPSTTGASVLSVDYPAGSYSHKTGGAQFLSQPLNVSGAAPEAYTTMLLAYDIFFPANFAFNQGGKLPGLRGGPDPRGCSGGQQTDGTKCFSTRLMWRTGRQGEVYAYIPTTLPGFCSESQVICDDEYGTSLARGSFTFKPGEWQSIWLLVQLNKVGTANGVLQLYYNGVQAMSFSNLEFRSSDSLDSVSGMYFSTFFGGSDASWASPIDQHTYYRNIQLMAGANVATGSGKDTKSAASHTTSSCILFSLFACFAAVYMGF